jgi:hypothetical protein
MDLTLPWSLQGKRFIASYCDFSSYQSLDKSEFIWILSLFWNQNNFPLSDVTWLIVLCTLYSSSTVAGILSTLITAPVDMVKTRLMLQRESKGGRIYKNGFNCAYQVLILFSHRQYFVCSILIFAFYFKCLPLVQNMVLSYINSILLSCILRLWLGIPNS